MKKKFRTFSEARKFARSLKLNGKIEWMEFTKSGKKPKNIPTDPYEFYKNKGWKNWKFFLGNEFLSCKEAGKFLRKQGLTSQRQYERWCKDGKRPNFIPATPSKTYKLIGTWKGWGDYLGTGTVAPQNREFVSFTKARKFVRKLKLKNGNEWKEYAKKNKKLLEKLQIPANPGSVYKKSYRGWGDWLGTGFIAYFNRKYPPFSEAKLEYQKLAKKYGLKNGREFMRFFRKNPDKLPKNLPAAPWFTYSRTEVLRRMKK